MYLALILLYTYIVNLMDINSMKLIRLVKKALNKKHSSQKQQELRRRLDFAMSQSKQA